MLSDYTLLETNIPSCIVYKGCKEMMLHLDKPNTSLFLTKKGNEQIKLNRMEGMACTN